MAFLLSHHPLVLPTDAFPRTLALSPDGSTLLALCENRDLRMYHLTERTLSPSLISPQPSPILDATWYPGANKSDPATYCFVASARECPVKLLDATDGRLRASYSIVDHRERQIAPHSISFNPSAQRLYCGFEDAVEIFDVYRPGEGRRVHTTPSKKSKDGLKGIISALAFSSAYSTSDFWAAGSLAPSSSNITLYSEESPIMALSGGPKAGVTQLHIPTAAPHMLFASFRRCPAIYSWDLRSNVDWPLLIYDYDDKEIRNPERLTNQKMRFDVDSTGRFLSTGDQRGYISTFDINSTMDITGTGEEHQPTIRRGPKWRFRAHNDSVGAVTFHPSKPFLISASGSRHFDLEEEDSSDEDEDETRRRWRERRKIGAVDASLSVWRFKTGDGDGDGDDSGGVPEG